MIRRPRLRPVRLANKVALLFFAITFVAFGTTFFYVVPQLRANLEERSLADLGRAAELSLRDLEELMGTDVPRPKLDEQVRRVADESDARVTLLGVQRSPATSGDLYVISDSRVGSEVDVSYEVAQLALAEGRTQTGIGSDAGEPAAQAAVPLSSQPTFWVALYSRPLDEVTNAVALIRGQIVVAGLIALVIALVGGYAIARALATRVRRLEVAARDIAARREVDPLPIDSDDELGDLTRTFNEMQAQLARVDRARDDFIANASHELRTPIFSLAGFAELLEDEDLDATTRAQFIRQMREQTERLRQLAVELLDLSRLDAGSMTITPERVDLREIATAVSEEFDPALARHRAGLTLELPPGEVDAWCDPGRVTQIARILLDNALRHTPSGTRVALSAASGEGGAELAVSDAGAGLEEEVQERIFDRFYTADAASGSGLGLAIARELAERMRGSIRLDSRPGRTTFTLCVPPHRDVD